MPPHKGVSVLPMTPSSQSQIKPILLLLIILPPGNPNVIDIEQKLNQERSLIDIECKYEEDDSTFLLQCPNLPVSELARDMRHSTGKLTPFIELWVCLVCFACVSFAIPRATSLVRPHGLE